MSEPSGKRDPLPAVARAAGGVDVLDDFLAAVLSQARRSTPVDIQAVSEGAGRRLSPDLVRILFGLLDEVGALSVRPSGAADVDRGQLISAIDDARTIAEARAERPSHNSHLQAELVCTLPKADPSFDEADPVDFGFGQITSRLLALCGQSDEEIVLFAPFLESEGIDWLLPGIEAAIRSGVDLRFVTRELEQGTEKYRTLQPLADLSDEHPGRVELYDYYAERSDGEYPLYTLHSKLLIVDEERAYIGSANFTTYGFQEFFEVGVAVEGEQVSDLHAMCSKLIDESARLVE